MYVCGGGGVVTLQWIYVILVLKKKLEYYSPKKGYCTVLKKRHVDKFSCIGIYKFM